MTDHTQQIHKNHPQYHLNVIEWEKPVDYWYALIDFNNNHEKLKRMAMTKESARERNVALLGSNLEWRPDF